jgi:hypothetical protein
MRPSFAALLALSLWACPKEEAPTDRTIERLKAEQERLRREGAPARRAAEPDPLAEVVAADSRPENLGIPAGVEADLGDLALALREVQIAQTVGARVRLSTTEQFVRVTLDATARKALDLDVSSAEVIQGEKRYPLARDAQRAAGGSPLARVFQAGDKSELVLFFEVPRAELKPGLKLLITSGTSRVELPLQ